MATLSVHLFGKFSLRCGEQVMDGFEGRKAQELFCYLLVHRRQQRSRELLASQLWGDSSTAQSKKSLRQALWHLQSALARSGAGGEPVFLIEPEWVQFNGKADCWVDLVVFESAWEAVQDIPGKALDRQQADLLRQAVELYQGDLLEGCYEDWCVYERERLQTLYLAMLDKLMAFCEAHDEYEAGLQYGARILKYDRARERTHRRLMTLYYLAGDRVAALRQYERCVAALDEELGVAPDERTAELYEQIRSNQFKQAAPAETPARPAPQAMTPALAAILGQLQQLQAAQAMLQRDLQRALDAIARTLEQQPNRHGAYAQLEAHSPVPLLPCESTTPVLQLLERSVGERAIA